MPVMHCAGARAARRRPQPPLLTRRLATLVFCRATAPRTLVRFVFCKTDEKLQTACDKLRKYLGK